MKKSIRYSLFSGLLIVSITFAGIFQSPTSSPEAPKNRLIKRVPSSLAPLNLINSDQSINKNLLVFMKLFGLTHEGTIESVNAALQKHFLRKPGLERRDLQDEPLDEQKRKRALQLLRKMSMIEAISYTPSQVDYFFLFGAMTSTMMHRTHNFVEQFQKRMRCKNVVLLGDVRRLRAEEIELLKGLNIDFQAFLQKVEKQASDLTEADAFRAVWETQVPDTIKAQFEEGHNLFFINSTDVTKGTNGRPTMGSTLEAWYDMCQPTPGHCHGNVELPYGIRMEKVLRTFLVEQSQQLELGSKKFSITWNSPTASKTLPISVYKDELARTFYQECKLRGYM